MIPSFFRRAVLAWLCALALAVPTVAARADTGPDARQFITKIVNSALQVLAQTKTDEAQRERQFSTLFQENFDIPRIARFVLGRYWRTASDEDRRRFTDTYRDFVIKSYASQFSQYSGETVKVIGAHEEEGDIIVVNSEIVHPSGEPPVKVAWRVHKDAGGYKIVDVDVEGVSMILAQREEFASVIQRNGGTISGLIHAIVQKMQTGAPSTQGG